MTGIERLREFGREQEERSWSKVGKVHGQLMLDIADQIDREQDEHARCQLADYLRVRAVERDMERHVLGHEGMEDSPVARWARELREALGGHVEEVTDVATIRKDAMEAYEWVSEHGGIEGLRSLFQDADSRRVELCAALGIDLDKGWSEAMAAMRLRLMPEGMEWLIEAWPRFEDGEPLRVGDEVCGGGRAFIVDHVVLFSNGESTVCAEADMDSGKVRDYARVRPSYRLKRPAPKVLDADGAEIREKCDVWWICEGDERGVHAERLRDETIGPNGLIECSPYNGGTWVYLEPSELYVNEPVIAADGRPLREGETVYEAEGTGHAYKVVGIRVGDYDRDPLTPTVVTCDEGDGTSEHFLPGQLTHQRSVLDADGVPIKEGDVVWCVATDDELTGMNIIRKNWSKMRAKLTVKSIISDSHGDKWADFEETYLYVKTCYLTHTNPGPRRTCQDCRFWQKDPTARTMGVCWRNYAERDCEDSYEARIEDDPACEYFRERGE